MATLPSYFNDYLANIRLTADQNEELKKAHETLRSLLKADEDLSGSIVATFLQGSYRRSTAVRPYDGSHADVDIIVVTSFNKDLITPSEALSKFVPFMEEHYKGKYRIQGSPAQNPQNILSVQPFSPPRFKSGLFGRRVQAEAEIWPRRQTCDAGPRTPPGLPIGPLQVFSDKSPGNKGRRGISNFPSPHRLCPPCSPRSPS